MNPAVDAYLSEGCGRCDLGGTPDCKVHSWTHLLRLLRSIIMESGVTEECKWGVACYTFQGKNIVILSALKNHAVLGFFKGALLKDEKKLLKSPGDNSQAVRQFVFSELKQVIDNELNIINYIKEAIEVEKAGKSIDFSQKNNLTYPEELTVKFNKNPELKVAFEALTPGRKRGYILYFNAPKKTETRVSRIDKFIPKILAGKGIHDK